MKIIKKQTTQEIKQAYDNRFLKKLGHMRIKVVSLSPQVAYVTLIQTITKEIGVHIIATFINTKNYEMIVKSIIANKERVKYLNDNILKNIELESLRDLYLESVIKHNELSKQYNVRKIENDKFLEKAKMLLN